MRRTAVGFAVPLLAAVAIGGPLAMPGEAAPVTLRCATATPPAACTLLDDLAAQLAPIDDVLGASLADLTGPAQDFAARSDQPTGVPTAEVVATSEALLDALGSLPDAVEALVGQPQLTELSDTLQALVAELTAPAGGDQQAAETSQPTPAKTATSTAPATSAPRSADSSSFGGSASTSGSSSTSSSSSPSSVAVPDVPVGDPLTLGPLALPDFGFSQTMEPVAIAAPADQAELGLAEAVDALPRQSRGVELAVVVILSLLLIGAAVVAQAQQNRRAIPD